MANNGWIKLHRSIMDSGVYSDNLRFKAWVDLILRVNHEDKEWFEHGKLVKVKKGQCITSIRALKEAWCCEKETVDKILKQFVEMGMIERNSRKGKYTIITVVKYGFYQGKGSHKADTEQDTEQDTEWDTHQDIEQDTEQDMEPPQTRTTRTIKTDTRNKENKKPASRIGFYDSELED